MQIGTSGNNRSLHLGTYFHINHPSSIPPQRSIRIEASLHSIAQSQSTLRIGDPFDRLNLERGDGLPDFNKIDDRCVVLGA
jgi:hypothetical protein